MTNPFHYDTLTQRNSGYISSALQQRIRDTRLLVAGCGMGSAAAICATRMGFTKFILVDGDTVNLNNLNRQFFDRDDIGKPKVDALKHQIQRINPEAEVTAFNLFLNAENTDAIVQEADVIFDTVDFLDLPAVLHLHDSAQRHSKPLFTALNVGFGGLVWYFPPDSPMPLSKALAADIAAASAGGVKPSYADVYASFVGRLKPFLDTDVVEHLSYVIAMMRDGTPCPASQLSPGSFTAAAMTLTAIQDMLGGAAVPASPNLLICSFKNHRIQQVDISKLV